MSRNAAGSYSLPAGNPVETGTTISPTWANPTMEDIAAALEDSLSRTGKGGMLAPIKNVSGLKTAPGIAFGEEPQSGIYRAGTGDIRIAVSGIDVLRIFNGQVQIWVPASAQWFNLVSVKGAGAVVEVQTLAAAQTVVPFTKNIAGAALYLNGISGDRGRLFLGTDYTYDSVSNEAVLTTDYPDGTLLAAVVNDETDVQAAAVAASDSANASAASAVDSSGFADASAASAVDSSGFADASAASAVDSSGFADASAASAALSEAAAIVFAIALG